MEAFRPVSLAADASQLAERLPFDLLRTLVATRQAATPTVHALAGAAPLAGMVRGDPADALLLVLTGHGDAMAGGARFAACSIGRVTASVQEVSA